MVFSSFPAYLDPANWQQQQPINHVGSSNGRADTHLTPPPPPPPPLPPGSGGGSSSIRPGSMSDRARMANIPMPEVALKCPRCDSSNTKFCYFNNYNLSQPRHFCKTCRRYWTRGGALRNVPVGGGCRRNNKRSNKGSSSSKSSGDHHQTTATSSGSVNMGREILGLGSQINSPIRFLTPHLSHEFSSNGEIGLNYGGISNFNLGNSLAVAGGGGGGGSGGYDHQWRLQPPQPQFSLFGGIMDNSNSNSSLGLMYPNFESGHVDNQLTSGYNGGSHFRPRLSSISEGVTTATTQLASVKMEDNNNNSNNNGELNLTRQCLGNDNIQYNWISTTTTTTTNPARTPWTDLSSFSSSSTSNPLS